MNSDSTNSNSTSNSRPLPPSSPSQSSSPSNIQRLPPTQTFSPQFYISQRSTSNHDSFPMQLAAVQSPQQTHYSPSPPGPPASAFTQRPTYISTYPVQPNPHTGVMQPQVYGYLPVPHRVQSQSDAMLHTLHTPVYRAPQHNASHYPYVQRVSPESVGLDHLVSSDRGGQSSSQLPSQFSTDPTYPGLQYVQSPPTPTYGYQTRSFSQNAPPLYQTTYVPAYSQSYYRESSTHDNASTWWYLPQPSSPGPSYDSPTAPPQQAGPLEYPSGPSTSHSEADTVTQNPKPRMDGVLPEEVGPFNAVDDARMIALSISNPVTSDSGQRKRSKSTPNVLQPARRPFHPNPPVNRSEWVMWVGNVPSDATHDELWNFFNGDTRSDTASIDRQPSAINKSTSKSLPRGGVVSVFLIARSNCAFVNFESEAHLENTVSMFNGKSLRPQDPRCAKLVCRIRRPDDDLKAGVGGSSR